ncbi:hypothetical protein [Natronococcus occultus]|uniref:Uncharacterized protein n=1 Tax=Natronococcus occultus SP4 TaxID=694430 RepID=L0K1C9_9EURY|nr:hypothetical protein [Natronococcus occultus]AGB38781.1 hypothetical protein Natoc_3035 [Natronococcus occultus SP4]
MNTHHIEREIEAHRLILEELSPDEHLGLFLEGVADDRDDWLETLRTTCPRHRYQMADHAYTERGRIALLFCHHALSDLHTTLLSFELERQSQHARWAIDLHSNEKPSDETLERAAERAERLRVLFGDLYVQYHAYEQFAEAVLGVSLETWSETHPDGGSVLGAVREVFEDDYWVELATEDCNEGEVEPGNDSWVTLEEVAAIRYEALRMMWEDAVPDL